MDRMRKTWRETFESLGSNYSGQGYAVGCGEDR